MAEVYDELTEEQPDPTVDLRDYQYVSQFAMDINGVNIIVAGVPTDPAANHVLVTMTNVKNEVQFSQVATRVTTGQYQIQFSSAQTSTPGYYTLTWTFTIGSTAQSTKTWIQVGAENPAYDTLPDSMKDIIETTWSRFSDMFDSPQGGPHLQVYFQTAFSRGRLAQLLKIAVGYLNTMAQPYANFSVEGNPLFPYQQWGPLLEQRLYLETMKHLIRSYIEQPNPIGVTVARMDRRDYVDRWNRMLDHDEKDFRSQLDTFKISMMGLGRPHVLVSGGVYGAYGPTRLPGSAAARARFWSRFY
jgi:hypothetical protein